jgi:two-component system chemotaxis response regulator CheY
MAEPMTLLITDDDRDFRESLGEILSRRGFVTLMADSGHRALEIVQSCSVELVMMDVHMPLMSGLETLAEIRRRSLTIPSILMSAKLDEGILAEARTLKTEEVLAKPFSIALLTTTINKALKRDFNGPK